MILKELIAFLEDYAPLSLQENYDNSGLLIGSPENEITAALICLDCTPEVVAEAIRKNCNLIITHHPIIFTGQKKINGKTYAEQAIITAIKHDVSIYAIHTNLDNISAGVNSKIAEKLGLSNTRILVPKKGLLKKLVVFVPPNFAEQVRQKLFDAGAGHIGNYDMCSFSNAGNGTFRAAENSNPFVGKKGVMHNEPELRIECILPNWLVNKAIVAIKEVHPYEEVAIDIYNTDNEHANIGSGLVGELAAPTDIIDFLHLVKKEMKVGVVRYTTPHKKSIKTVAVCGGSGSFLLNDAIRANADVFVTADFKYHQFFDTDNKIVIADIGHYESEQFTIELLNDWIAKKFVTFATHLTETVTNPVRYL